LPKGWCDVTDSLPSGNPPTLALGNQGHGVIQFSIAHYKMGPKPDFTTEVLKGTLDDFQRNQEMSCARNFARKDGILRLVQADFTQVRDFVRAYYVSDGSNVCFATYRCELSCPELQSEVREADLIIDSIEF
jgi:hypothetical protein